MAVAHTHSWIRYGLEKWRLDFKLNPRTHIGYLMGYMSSNSWWIWVPVMNKCILTSANRETRQFGKFVSKVSESLGFAVSTMSN